MDALHDATNAFASTTTATHAHTIDKDAAPLDHPLHDLFLQRQRNACVDVHAADGVLQVRSSSENLVGMLRKLPWLEDVPSVIDISTVAFADDIRVVLPFEINVLSTPAREAARFFSFAVNEAHLFSGELKAEVYTQNG